MQHAAQTTSSSTASLRLGTVQVAAKLVTKQAPKEVTRVVTKVVSSLVASTQVASRARSHRAPGAVEDILILLHQVILRQS